jgi:hypothetical protein
MHMQLDVWCVVEEQCLPNYVLLVQQSNITARVRPVPNMHALHAHANAKLHCYTSSTPPTRHPNAVCTNAAARLT